MSRCQYRPKTPTTTVNARVMQVQQHTATVALSATAKKNCTHCQGKGGCQSLSLYQLLFAQKPLTIRNDNYHTGQSLDIQFPNSLIQSSVLWLLGLPLAGFVIGVVLGGIYHELAGFSAGVGLAFLGYYLGKKHVSSRLSRYLTIQSTS